MADIQLSSGSKRHVSVPRVDLTPMVDLGFLLITFFMYTTTMTEAKMMDINMPYSPPPPNTETAYIESASMTMIPIKDHRILYYFGILNDKDNFQETNVPGIRNIIKSRQTYLKTHPASKAPDATMLHVLIKPDVNSKYNDLISILDEMTINAVPYYAITDMTEEEKNMLTKKLQ